MKKGEVVLLWVVGLWTVSISLSLAGARGSDKLVTLLLASLPVWVVCGLVWVTFIRQRTFPRFSFPRFSRAWLRCLGVALLVILGVFVILSWQHKREFEASKKRILKDEVVLADLQLVDINDLFGYRLVGRIRNKSTRFALTEVRLLIRVKDCIENNCDIVAEKIRSIRLNIPPGQARDLDTLVSGLFPVDLSGKLEWDMKIEYIRGAKP